MLNRAPWSMGPLLERLTAEFRLLAAPRALTLTLHREDVPSVLADPGAA